MNDNLTLCVPRLSSGHEPYQPVLIRTKKPEQCPPNHVLIKVDRFGFSANNITYQTLGEHPHFRYFDFHDPPTIDDVSPKTHGLIPVWGYGTVVKSTHQQIQEGERVYGYFAPARYLLVPVSPKDVNKYAFYVPRPHLPRDRRPYNQIIRCSSDPQHSSDPAVEDLTMLYRPLFWTSYWFEDWLYLTSYRNACKVLVSSASSKTAFCLAYLIKKRFAQRNGGSRRLHVVGLTSRDNIKFTQGLEHYDEVLEYDHFTSSPTFRHGKDERWIYIDVASNEGLNQRIVAHFASPYTGVLVTCITLGLTNTTPSSSASSIEWTKGFEKEFASAGTLSTSQFWPKFENFFMPEWLEIRKREMTVSDLFDMQNLVWNEFMKDCVDWLRVTRTHGAPAVLQAYRDVVERRVGPYKGIIWSLWDEENRINCKL